MPRLTWPTLRRVHFESSGGVAQRLALECHSVELENSLIGGRHSFARFRNHVPIRRNKERPSHRTICDRATQITARFVTSVAGALLGGIGGR